MSQTEVQLIKADAVVTADIANSAVTDAKIAALTSSKLSGALPAISGASLTNLPASGKATNIVLNGAMNLAQRGTSSTVTGYKTVDRFVASWGGVDEACTQSQVDVASGTTPYTLGFRKALGITNGNQTSGADATDIIYIEHMIEAQDIANSGWNYTSSSSYITLSFWVKSSVSQDFKGYIRTVDGTSQRYPYSTGTLSANTWTKITKTIPGNSNLQFDNNNEAGLQLYLWPYIGTTYTDAGVTENAWASYASGTRTPVSATTWYTTNDATFEITGVQLEVGDTATDFAYESFNETLLKCKRYCHVLADANYTLLGIGMQYYSATIFIDAGPIDMRTTPTMVAKAGVSGASNYEKIFSNSAQYIHQIALDSKTKKDRVLLSMSGDASRAGQAVRCAAHFFTLSNNEPFVYLQAEL